MIKSTILVTSLCLIYIEASVIQGGELKSEQCDGQVELIALSKESITYTDNSTSINYKPTKAILSGCKCFRLFEKINGRGRSFFLNKIGETYVPLKKVKSLYNVPCEKYKLKRRHLKMHQISQMPELKEIPETDPEDHMLELKERERNLHNEIRILKQTVSLMAEEIEILNKYNQ